MAKAFFKLARLPPFKIISKKGPRRRRRNRIILPDYCSRALHFLRSLDICSKILAEWLCNENERPNTRYTTYSS